MLARSIFSKILTIATPYLARQGEVWRVYCVFSLWLIFCNNMCNTVLYDCIWLSYLIYAMDADYFAMQALLVLVVCSPGIYIFCHFSSLDPCDVFIHSPHVYFICAINIRNSEGNLVANSKVALNGLSKLSQYNNIDICWRPKHHVI